MIKQHIYHHTVKIWQSELKGSSLTPRPDSYFNSVLSQMKIWKICLVRPIKQQRMGQSSASGSEKLTLGTSSCPIVNKDTPNCHCPELCQKEGSTLCLPCRRLYSACTIKECHLRNLVSAAQGRSYVKQHGIKWAKDTWVPTYRICFEVGNNLQSYTKKG
jgi:hypothetical protein